MFDQCFFFQHLLQNYIRWTIWWVSNKNIEIVFWNIFVALLFHTPWHRPLLAQPGPRIEAIHCAFLSSLICTSILIAILYLWVLASVFLLYLLLYLCCACFCICALQLGNAENSDWEKVSWQLKHQPQLLGDDDDDDDDVVAQSKHAPYASSSGPYAFFII